MIVFLKVVYYTIFTITFIYGMYFLFSGLIGLLRKRKERFVKGKGKHKFAILIPARNEELVIGSLLESLNELNYPKDKFDIYVIPNNCTDKTQEVSKENGAKIITCETPTKTKGDVLKIALAKLEKEKDIDAYIIFDADNVVHPDFLLYMDDALEKGYNVAEGYRDAKNPGDNYISGSYTLFYLMQNVFFNQARMPINGSSSINGTGFMMKKEYIETVGFETYSLTEDVEFTGQCALRKEKIAYVEEAITYDEYPTKFGASWNQRKRWSAGNIECMKLYTPKLIKNFFQTGNIASLDMGLVYMGPFMQVLSLVVLIMLIGFRIASIDMYDIFSYFANWGLVFFLLSYITCLLTEIFVLVYKKKNPLKIWKGVLLFLFFIFTWIPINILCFIKKQTKWDAIKHDRVIKINEIKK